MTLRVTLEIIPHGVESQAFEIFHLDISNTGLIRNEGFGHDICSYEYFLMKPVPNILKKEGGPSHDIEAKGIIPEHDRRDGAFSLVNKVINDIGEV